jgi:hypothetical protein
VSARGSALSPARLVGELNYLTISLIEQESIPF